MRARAVFDAPDTCRGTSSSSQSTTTTSTSTVPGLAFCIPKLACCCTISVQSLFWLKASSSVVHDISIPNSHFIFADILRLFWTILVFKSPRFGRALAASVVRSRSRLRPFPAWASHPSISPSFGSTAIAKIEGVIPSTSWVKLIRLHAKVKRSHMPLMEKECNNYPRSWPLNADMPACQPKAKPTHPGCLGFRI